MKRLTTIALVATVALTALGVSPLPASAQVPLRAGGAAGVPDGYTTV
mgnify:CR=1 FL=1